MPDGKVHIFDDLIHDLIHDLTHDVTQLQDVFMVISCY